jgi:hypothetical protein
MLAQYDDTMTMREARRVYFDVNSFGEDGGYFDAWVDFHLGPIPMPFPNTEGRLRAVRYHDLHHVLTGYDTDTRGEFEISAWELAAGCGGFPTARMLNLAGLGAGLFAAPVRVFRAFVRGRRERTVYGEDLEALLARRVGELRAERASSAAHEATAADVVAFVGTSLAALLAGAAGIVIFVPLAPVGVVMNAFRPRAKAPVSHA